MGIKLSSYFYQFPNTKLHKKTAIVLGGYCRQFSVIDSDEDPQIYSEIELRFVIHCRYGKVNQSNVFLFGWMDEDRFIMSMGWYTIHCLFTFRKSKYYPPLSVASFFID